MLPSGYSRDADGIYSFNRTLIEATHDLVCAYKPNFAFYEALGYAGLRALERTLAIIPEHIPTIADAKRGDVPNTARLYAQALFAGWNFDSATVSPYMGPDSLEPFLDWPGKGVWVLCRTSNPGASYLQSLEVAGGTVTSPLFARVIEMVDALPSRADKGLVVGATSPKELRQVRARVPAMPLLLPGIGAQGGDVLAAAHAAATGPVVINASRSVLYGSGAGDTASAVRERAAALKDRINSSLYSFAESARP